MSVNKNEISELCFLNMPNPPREIEMLNPYRDVVIASVAAVTAAASLRFELHQRFILIKINTALVTLMYLSPNVFFSQFYFCQIQQECFVQNILCSFFHVVRHGGAGACPPAPSLAESEPLTR